jgi:hypothetical protein
MTADPDDGDAGHATGTYVRFQVHETEGYASRPWTWIWTCCSTGTSQPMSSPAVTAGHGSVGGARTVHTLPLSGGRGRRRPLTSGVSRPNPKWMRSSELHTDYRRRSSCSGFVSGSTTSRTPPGVAAATSGPKMEVAPPRETPDLGEPLHEVPGVEVLSEDELAAVVQLVRALVDHDEAVLREAVPTTTGTPISSPAGGACGTTST